ncbi:hypothetical protein EVAR_88101_1 [Eumeta japonica]|uniref:Uncharacterized protein n=1 Tax=Eumeta variegata TaxID=151549 RepID=A0A4C1WJH8_EUMVA|nr:hypothetical protein EVAR_88101_1 [Eumeta japonica]
MVSQEQQLPPLRFDRRVKVHSSSTTPFIHRSSTPPPSSGCPSIEPSFIRYPIPTQEVSSLLFLASAVRGAAVAPETRTENATEMTASKNETQMALDDDFFTESENRNGIGDESADVRGDLIFVASKLVKLYKHFRRADGRILKNMMFIFTSVGKLLGPYIDIIGALKGVFTPAFAKALIFILQ